MAQTMTDVIDKRIEALTARLSSCDDRIAEIKQQEPTDQLVRELSGLILNKRRISEELEDWTAIK